MNTFSHFKEVLVIKKAKNLIVMGAFFYLGLGIWQFNTSIFLKEIFHWGPHFIGGVFMLVGICDILSRVILLPIMLKRWTEQTVGSIGLIGLSIGLVFLFFSSFQQSIIYVAAAVAFIVLGEGLFDPSYNARLSVSVDESKQGVLQGTNHSLQALYRIIVPLGAAFIYSIHPGAVFALASVLMIFGLGLFSRLK